MLQTATFMESVLMVDVFVILGGLEKIVHNRNAQMIAIIMETVL